MLTLADRLHDRVWSGIRTIPVGERLWSDRGARGLTLALIAVAVALAATAVAPLALLVAAPLLLGVPHVAADLRHLVVRPPQPLPRTLVGALAVPLVALIGLRLGVLFGAAAAPRVELAIGSGAVALAAGWGGGRAGWLTVAATAAALGLALVWPRQAALAFGHVHNLVAVAIWCAWVGDRRVWMPVVAVLGGAVALVAAGALDAPLVAAAPTAGHTLQGFVTTLAPDLPGPWGLRAVAAYALLQAVHYGMWLVCIPAAGRVVDLPTAPTDRWASWRTDLGALGVVAVVLGAVLLAVAGWVDPVTARSGYLSLVLFHGWLELAVGAHLAARHAAG